MSDLHDWEPEGNSGMMVRRDELRRVGEVVSPPGDADNGRWGWFVVNHKGHSNGSGEDKAPSKEEAMRLADLAYANLPS